MAKRLILGVDFDGTVVTHRFPAVGQDAPHAARVIKRLIKEKGFIIVLNTMRSHKTCYNPTTGKTCSKIEGKRLGLTTTLDDAVNWFEKNSIPLSGINKSPGQENWTDSPKVYATHYVDDAAIGSPIITLENGEECVDWLTIEQIIFENNR